MGHAQLRLANQYLVNNMNIKLIVYFNDNKQRTVMDTSHSGCMHVQRRMQDFLKGVSGQTSNIKRIRWVLRPTFENLVH